MNSKQNTLLPDPMLARRTGHARRLAQYAENKNPKDRLFQTGESWRTLVQFFNLKPEEPCDYLLSCFYRFSAEDDSPGNSLRRSLIPLTIEDKS